jgi:hypothetical protein
VENEDALCSAMPLTQGFMAKQENGTRIVGVRDKI